DANIEIEDNRGTISAPTASSFPSAPAAGSESSHSSQPSHLHLGAGTEQASSQRSFVSAGAPNQQLHPRPPPVLLPISAIAPSFVHRPALMTPTHLPGDPAPGVSDVHQGSAPLANRSGTFAQPILPMLTSASSEPGCPQRPATAMLARYATAPGHSDPPAMAHARAASVSSGRIPAPSNPANIAAHPRTLSTSSLYSSVSAPHGPGPYNPTSAPALSTASVASTRSVPTPDTSAGMPPQWPTMRSASRSLGSASSAVGGSKSMAPAGLPPLANTLNSRASLPPPPPDHPASQHEPIVISSSPAPRATTVIDLDDDDDEDQDEDEDDVEVLAEGAAGVGATSGNTGRPGEAVYPEPDVLDAFLSTARKGHYYMCEYMLVVHFFFHPTVSDQRWMDALATGAGFARPIFTKLAKDEFRNSRSVTSVHNIFKKITRIYKDLRTFLDHFSDFLNSDVDDLIAKINMKIAELNARGVKLELNGRLVVVFMRQSWYYWIHAHLQDLPSMRTTTEKRSGAISPPCLPTQSQRLSKPARLPQNPPRAPHQHVRPLGASGGLSHAKKGKGSTMEPPPLPIREPQGNTSVGLELPPPPSSASHSTRDDAASNVSNISTPASRNPSVSNLRAPRNPSTGRSSCKALSSVGHPSRQAPPASRVPTPAPAAHLGGGSGQSVADTADDAHSHRGNVEPIGYEIGRNQRHYNGQVVQLKERQVELDRQALETKFRFMEREQDGNEAERAQRMEIARREHEGNEREREHRMQIASERAAVDQVNRQMNIVNSRVTLQHNLLLNAITTLSNLPTQHS
ncbi:hypothetical protein FRC06_009219, partial [Ceratobasidium sp. 370]